MLKKMISRWKNDPDILNNIVCWQTEEKYSGDFVNIPESLAPKIRQALQNKNIYQLYKHQWISWKTVKSGKNIVVVTSTASGKSLCYNLPVLETVFNMPEARALYIFPTKALAQDQKNALLGLISEINPCPGEPGDTPSITTEVYDGDTPQYKRQAIRKSTRLLITNPDMIHAAILPHHTLWAEFFQNLRFIIIDEIHTYRGVFGSHVANVIRRLKRITRFYGSAPQFILTSATIANPVDHAKRLIEEPVSFVDQDGSPKGVRHFIIYNPPVVNSTLGIRNSPLKESIRLERDLLAYNVQSILFARSRRAVEHLLRSLREQCDTGENDLRGYRSGYLPTERRQIEKGLRAGHIRSVVATNALELGIDIGSIDSVIMAGYPGSIAATRQQSGRAGRRSGEGLSVLITSNNPLDQFLAQNPQFLLEQPPEKALINPDNLLILLQHLRCAAFELPFRFDETYGTVDRDLLLSLLQLLAGEGLLHPSKDRYFWVADQYPAQNTSLRTTTAERIVLLKENDGENNIIGIVDKTSAKWMVHPGAVYLHEGESYLVEELDLENRIARLREWNQEEYTEPIKQETVECLETNKEEKVNGGQKCTGEIMVTSQVVGYKRIRWITNEILETVDLTMPPETLRTNAYWVSLNDETINRIREMGLWRSKQNEYGPGWAQIRDAIRKRDQFTCQVCGKIENGQPHHVHHKIPFKQFVNQEAANQPDNLITLCPQCHRIAELSVKVRSGLAGILYIFHQLAPLFLMCDTADLGAHMDYHCAFMGGYPSVLLYEQIPAGIGLSEELFNQHNDLVASALQRLKHCPCEDGCPACVGPSGPEGTGAKAEALAILESLTGSV